MASTLGGSRWGRQAVVTWCWLGWLGLHWRHGEKLLPSCLLAFLQKTQAGSGRGQQTLCLPPTSCFPVPYGRLEGEGWLRG